MKRTARAIWQGGLKRGQGTLTTESGEIRDIPFNFSQRFEDAHGTNPEELIGAGYVSCFTMALAGELEKRGYISEKLNVISEVHLDKTVSGWKIPQIHLRISATVPGASIKEIDEIASHTKDNCPVGKILNTHVSIEIHIPTQESVSPQSMI